MVKAQELVGDRIVEVADLCERGKDLAFRSGVHRTHSLSTSGFQAIFRWTAPRPSGFSARA